MKTIRFTIYENGEAFDSAEVETYTELSELINSIEKFQHIVNSTITEKIKGGDILDDLIEDNFDSSEGEEEPARHEICPKKRKL